MPIAKSASISVTTCSSANSTSFAKTGRPDTSVPPINQNHDSASTGRNSSSRDATCCDDVDRVVQQARAGDVRRARRRERNEARADPAGQRDRDAEHADDERAVVDQHQRAAEDRAEQDREERARLDQRIAGDQLVLAEVLGQQGVLDRPEDRRVRAEAEERDEQQRHARQREARSAPCAMMKISAIFTQRAIFALSTRSASVPEAPENRKNGAMKMPPASMTSVAASMPPRRRGDTSRRSPARSSTGCR